MITTRYFRYRTGGFAFDYFGYIGDEEEISRALYYILRLLKYRCTYQRYSNGIPLMEVNKRCRWQIEGEKYWPWKVKGI
jgi:hypothetical protein